MAPMKSKRQNRAMHAAAADGNLGIPPSVAKEYVAEQHGKSLAGKPEKAAEPRRGTLDRDWVQREAAPRRSGQP